MKYLLLTTIISASCISFGQKTGNGDEPQSKFDEVMENISLKYVDNVDEEALEDAAIVAALEKLDPHSTYVSKDDVADAMARIDGSFVGIGIRFQILKDTLMVVATIPGGPSEKLGLQPGDKIVMIEDENVAGVGLKNSQVRERLLGEKGTKVKVQIERKKMSKPIDFVITRDVIPVNSVEASYMVTDSTGYIKLNSFSRSSLEEVRKSILKLKSEGMTQLIFDLQGNPGGLLYASKYIADEFLSGRKLVVYSEGRAQPRADLMTEYNGLFEEGRLVLLTDEYSASASEILSGAVQDWDRGLVVGRRTFGKGLVQRPIDLSDGSQIRLTIARYYTPSGRFIQKPYEDKEAYRSDLLNRYENGEFMHQDSIKFPDSLKFETLVNHRIVYGGGGIMPDVFVPLDTNGVTDYYSSLIRAGHVNTFVLEYTNANREQLQSDYQNFDAYKEGFKTDEAFMQTFFDYVAAEEKDLDEEDRIEFDEEAYEESKELLGLRMKAMIARNLWSDSEFYEVYNDSNEILQRAIEIIESDTYNLEANED